MPEPTLTRFGPRRGARGVVLVLHGGQEHSSDPVLRRHGSWLRMLLAAKAIQRAARRHGVAVWLLRYQVRGWNARHGAEPAPVRDARWAIDRIRAEHPGVPVVLLGHSMGGRTANVVSDDKDVVGVVALAPWLPSGEPVRTTTLLVLHGTADTWTSPTASRQHVARVRQAGGRAAWFPVEGGDHALLRFRSRWHSFAGEGALGLLGVRDLPPDAREALGPAQRGPSGHGSPGHRQSPVR